MDNQFTVKRVLHLSLFATLGMLSVSAFSQSAEYRRGYDQGYRDGTEAQASQGQPGQGQPPGWGGRIVIEDATYGTRDGSCNLRDAIQSSVGRRRHIDIRADNALCGDPSPNRVKRLDVLYHCGDGPVQHAQTREGGTITLSCR